MFLVTMLVILCRGTYTWRLNQFTNLAWVILFEITTRLIFCLPTMQVNDTAANCPFITLTINEHWDAH